MTSLTISNLNASDIETCDVGNNEILILKNIGIKDRDCIYLQGKIKVLIVIDSHCISEEDDDKKSKRFSIDVSHLQELEWVINLTEFEGCILDLLTEKKIREVIVNSNLTIVFCENNGLTCIDNESPFKLLKIFYKMKLPETALKILAEELSFKLLDIRELDELFFPADEKVLRQLKERVECDITELNQGSLLKLKKNLYEKDNYFSLPIELRNGSITPEHIRNWVKNKYDLDKNNAAEEICEIFIGLDALIGIRSLFINQEYFWDIECGKRLCSGSKCMTCGIFDKNMYTCCDTVYPFQKTWFNSLSGQCKNCNSMLFLDYILLLLLPKELIEIIKNYLQPPYTMALVNDDKKVNLQNTSTIFEWLPIFKFNTICGNFIFFINCNPTSKFYGLIFKYGYRCSRENSKMEFITLNELTFSNSKK